MQSSVRAWIRSTFRSLAARVSFFVFAATLISALAVAWTSAHALRAFLRSKVEQKIPATVEQVRDRLDLWYAQRTLDVQVFARSAIVVDGLTAIARGGSGAGPPKDRAELEQYLTYVLEGLPQYTSIFVLDSAGRLLLGVGKVPDLAPELLRRLSSTEEVEISDVVVDREARSDPDRHERRPQPRRTAAPHAPRRAAPRASSRSSSPAARRRVPAARSCSTRGAASWPPRGPSGCPPTA